MSNPAVIKLQSGSIGHSKFWMDDNFGEAIHIHIDDIRVDLSVNEFRQLYEDTCKTLSGLVDVENFDASKIDPIYLAVMLRPLLPDLIRVTYDKVKLGDLMAPFQSKFYKLSESVGVKALLGISDEGIGYRKSHHIGQTETMRMDSIMKSIKENGYPYNDNYIVLYGDDNYIRDGQHRASCLYVLYGGDMEIPVLRFHFKNYKTPQINKYTNTRIMQFYKKEKGKVIGYCVWFLNITKKIGRRLLILKPRKKTRIKTFINPNILRLFDSK